jgi:hypothetical protein
MILPSDGVPGILIEFPWTGHRIALFVMQESRCTGLEETLDGGFDG